MQAIHLRRRDRAVRHYVRTTCDDPASELVCTDSLGENATEVLQVAVTAGTPYYVYVDGYTSESYGPYDLASELQ